MKVLITSLVIIFFAKYVFATNLEAQNGNINIQNQAYFAPDEQLKIGALHFKFDPKNNLAKSNSIVLKNNISETLKNSTLELNNELFILWDQQLISPKTYDVISKGGQTLVSGDIIVSKIISTDKHHAFQIPLQNLDTTDFKVCLKNNFEDLHAILCSQFYSFKNKNLVESDFNSEEKVLIFNELTSKSQKFELKNNEYFLFFTELKNGIIYDLKTKIESFKVVGYQISENKLYIAGEGLEPKQTQYRTVASEESSFIKAIGFSSTIKKPIHRWYVQSEDHVIDLKFNGIVGGEFDLMVESQSKVSTPKLTYINTDDLDSTYLFENKISFMSDQNKLVSLTAPIDREGELNELQFEYKHNDSVYKIKKNIYHLTDQELSVRGFIVPTKGQTVLNSELSYSHWFETLFGTDSYYFSKLRWGMQAKVSQSLNTFEVEDGDKVVDEKTNSTNLDLKYRFTPGTWGRDESVGLILSHQQVAFGDYKLSEMGVGLFWARSMPQVFDDLFNLIPIFRYPKWVDVEFINYSSILNKSESESSGANYNLNFHGKIFWSKRIFGEAGFGIKKYDFKSVQDDTRFNFHTIYGSVGLGLNF